MRKNKGLGLRFCMAVGLQPHKIWTRCASNGVAGVQELSLDTRSDAPNPQLGPLLSGPGTP